MQLKRIRMELGRVHDYPEGSSSHGYEFVAPLTKDGHVDVEAWHKEKAHCTVRRFWGSDPEQRGSLRHVGHGGWRFDYPGRDTSDDEPLFKLEQHVLAPGAYISVTEQNDEQLPFKIVSIVPA